MKTRIKQLHNVIILQENNQFIAKSKTGEILTVKSSLEEIEIFCKKYDEQLKKNGLNTYLVSLNLKTIYDNNTKEKVEGSLVVITTPIFFDDNTMTMTWRNVSDIMVRSVKYPQGIKASMIKALVQNFKTITHLDVKMVKEPEGYDTNKTFFVEVKHYC